MKLPETLKPSRLFAKDRRGVALVTVLTVMALTTILVLTFFSLATSEHRASNTYSNGLQAQQVGEQAVNFVIAQIREATTVGTKKAWASQPGAIRQWEADTGGVASFAYKLYSDDEMKTTDWNEFQMDFLDMKGWSTKPEHYVDLNEPVIRGEKVYYPIVHPSASAIPDWPQELGEDQDGVEGFSYNLLPGRQLMEGGEIGDMAARIAKSRDGHVPMPAKWIYQLADGTLGVLNESGAGGTFRVIAGGGSPSSKNPIVARFAFWADDETTKLNVNTHAGGLAWDIPKAGGELDMNMGRYQPAQHEWQRYPGHPASTHLIPALAPGVLDIVNDREAMEMLFKVVPRVVGGGSESGTRVIDTRRKDEQNGLIADKEPLFPTIDDVIMRSDRTPHEFPDSKGRPIPDDELSEYLERSKFFITANSRAPEINMFNLPRIAMWPVYDANIESPTLYDQYLTPFDQLIHYCASMGKSAAPGYPRYEYVFKRKKADSSTNDYEIPRNKILYDYLNRSLTTPIPGYGQSFGSKYGEKSAAQLATMAFDYIRSTNLHDDTVYRERFEDAFKTVNTSEHATFTNPRDGNEQNKGFGLKGHGQVTPLRIQAAGVTTKGMGRFFTLSSSEILVASIGAHASDPDPRNSPVRYPGVGAYNSRHSQLEGGGVAYTNLPPLPVGVNAPNDADKSAWPDWLRDLEMSGPAEEFQAAFEPSNWNWQLGFLDPTYASAVMADPTANKYNRTLITRDGSNNMRLEEGARLMQGIFLFNLFCPSIGWVSINPNLQIEIEKTSGGGMTFDGKNAFAASGPIGFIGFDGAPGYDQNADDLQNGFVWATNWVKPVQEAGARPYGGLIPFTFTFSGREVHGEKGRNAPASVRNQLWNPGKLITSSNIFSRLTPMDRGYNHLESAVQKVKSIRSIGENSVENVAQAYRYDLITLPFKVPAGGSVKFNGGEVLFRFFDGGEFCENSAQDDQDDADSKTLVQTIELEYPDFQFGLDKTFVAPGDRAYVNEFDELESDSFGVLEKAGLSADPANPWDSPDFSAMLRGGSWKGSLRPPQAPRYFQSTDPKDLNNRGRMSNSIHWNGRYIGPGDIVQSVAVPHGDMRVVASRAEIVIEDKLFLPHRDYGDAPMAHSLTNSMGQALTGFDPNASKDYLIIPDLPKIGGHPPYRGAAPLPFAREKSQDVQLYGDFDNGAGLMIDGPYINKPDEGNTHSLKTRFTQEVNNYWESRRNYGEFPYFSNPEYGESGGPSYFSPNRIVSGPGMFGSLPTSLFSNPPKPWQTLLFRPNVVGNGYRTHPGAGRAGGGDDPPDHVFMDLFWMPIVEPYAISEPLSTAGKVNLNFDIVPYQHIQRSTALRGVFRSEMMLCIPNKWHKDYKHDRGRGERYHWRDNPYGGALQGKRLRAAIREDDTIAQFYDRFDDGANIFKSATEICEIHLIPEEISARMNLGAKGSIGSYVPTVGQMENGRYWRDHSLVGDNSRERPYTNIQNRITTKSNTFLVHYRAQVLKQARREGDAEYGEWRPTTDTVQAEYRGSSIVERYVNPEATDIPDFARDFGGGNIDMVGLDAYVRYRVVNPRRFAP